MAKLGGTYKGDTKKDINAYKRPTADNSLNIGSYLCIGKADLQRRNPARYCLWSSNLAHAYPN